MRARAALAALICFVSYIGIEAVNTDRVLRNASVLHEEIRIEAPFRENPCKSSDDTCFMNFVWRKHAPIGNATYNDNITKNIKWMIGWTGSQFSKIQNGFSFIDKIPTVCDEMIVRKNHIPEFIGAPGTSLVTNFFSSRGRARVSIGNERNFGTNPRIQRWRLTNIVNVDFYDELQSQFRIIGYVAGGLDIKLNPWPLIGSHGFLQGCISLIKNGCTNERSDNQKSSPYYQPFCEASYRIALAKPPQWHWLALFGAAMLSFLFSLILAPNVQPAHAARNYVSAILYIAGILLGIASGLMFIFAP